MPDQGRGVSDVTKAVVRSLCPPVLWDFGRSVKSRLHEKTPAPAPHRPFVGPLDSWREAVERSDGWDADAITAKSLDAAICSAGVSPAVSTVTHRPDRTRHALRKRPQGWQPGAKDRRQSTMRDDPVVTRAPLRNQAHFGYRANSLCPKIPHGGCEAAPGSSAFTA